MDLSELGFTREELQDRVIEGIVERLMSRRHSDEDGDSFFGTSEFADRLEKRIQKGIDDAVGAVAEKHVLPNVHAYIESLTLQTTNKWGEAQGKRVTFIEYLTERAEAYMKEDVNFEGKAKNEANGYGWSKSQTRIAHMIDAHLHYSIKSAMEGALKAANSAIAEGIEKTVKIKLDEVVKGISATVKVK